LESGQNLYISIYKEEMADIDHIEIGTGNESSSAVRL
jgi:hypothetical protein